MTKYNLERLANDLREILGKVWTIQVYSAKDCKETREYDPPCAYLKAECRLAHFFVSIEGDVNSGGGGAGWFTLTREGGHKERVKQLVRWLKEGF